MPLPARYTLIAEARPKEGHFVNLIGIAVGFRPPKMSYGSDWQACIELCDESAAVYENNLTVRIFRPDAESLPQAIDIGESIVVFKDVQMKVLRNQGNTHVGMTNKIRSSWVICKAEMPNTRRKSGGPNQRPERPRIRIVDNGPYRIQDIEKRKELLTEEEYNACKDLFEHFHTRGGLAGCHGMTERTYQDEAKPQKNIPKKAALMKEIKLDNFYDLTCFVQKVWSHNRFVEVTVTDFTENKELYPMGVDPLNDENRPPMRSEVESYALEGGGVTRNPNKFGGKKWFERPFGHYSLKVACWDSWAQKARSEITEGCYLTFTNILIKRGKGGQWEGSLSDGKEGRKKGDFRDGFKILRPDDPALKPLHNRKRELVKLVAQKEHESNEEERKMKEEEAKAKLAAELKKRQENNPQVHCGYISIETTPLRKIYNMLDGTDVEFFNRRYRTECRVVDFRPSDIRDFARPIDGDLGACGVDLNSPEYAENPPQWYWCFELDVIGKEDNTLLTIRVDDASGRYLLSPGPCDLRADENRHKFEELRNELFHLWGNLEEIKTTRRDRIDFLEQTTLTLISQYNQNYDHRFLEQQWRRLEEQRQEIQGTPIIFDPAVSNKYFFAIIKEYGEDDEDGNPERMFILENTSVSRAIVAREREKAVERLERERAAKAQEGVGTSEGVDIMDIDG
ncbi:hypothetical protein TWF730_006782 [Orbilia blumenaviensis]|uniref:Protection of telomeres protein 1 n=1 Tax=Orbilia blumenaviensis TaxID=1796055 RepID=A0AAV9VFA0_9PEZI